jgi:hypothetical protein
MSSDSKDKYEFTENILKLSETKDPTQLHIEWVLIDYEKIDETKVRCICNRNIGHVYRYYNTKTKHAINVGSECKKKLHLTNCHSSNSIIHKFISGDKGTYEKICDLIKYSNEVWKQFLEHIHKGLASWPLQKSICNLENIIKILSENNIDCKDLSNILNIYLERDAKLRDAKEKLRLLDIAQSEERERQYRQKRDEIEKKQKKAKDEWEEKQRQINEEKEKREQEEKEQREYIQKLLESPSLDSKTKLHTIIMEKKGNEVKEDARNYIRNKTRNAHPYLSDVKAEINRRIEKYIDTNYPLLSSYRLFK